MSLLVVATTNPGKLAELRRLLAGEDVVLHSLADHPEVPEVVEDGETFEENARKKAQAVARATGLPALADDSGLEVDALAGEPGVRSARWSGRGDRANNDRLLAELELRPGAPRTARFRAVLALAWPSGEIEVATGSCEGEIAIVPRGTNGFGYDPLFVVTGENGRTYAELEGHEKDRHSHRAAALGALWPRARDRLAR
ncbi:MAG: RdgB/HAM1 family non-canonical purine NTP pyrophosphatase [Deltaproteobacteria bacterium]|nr:RdgB/HAM1 family non-canonical purine NTP pyrophosphatase [Deltaproteobacteria bacterium]